MKNVFGYVRVSTKKQGEGVSLPVQKSDIERYAASHGLKVIQWFEEQESASKRGRPLFNTIVKLLKAGKATGVIVHKLDRSARNWKDWSDLGDIMDSGVNVYTAVENLDLGTRSGRLSADILIAFATDYIRNLKQEVKKGIYGRLEEGIYPFNAPIGYVNNGGGKYKTIDPIQGPLVRRAFEFYATKKFTYESLVTRMNILGLRSRNGAKMTITALAAILANPFYIGILEVKGQHFNGGHEPLISPALFKRVTNIRLGKMNTKVIKHDFIFRKKIVCAQCGYRLIPEKQKGRVYYRCHIKTCSTSGIREDTAENFLMKSFQAVQLYDTEVATIRELLGETDKNWSVENEMQQKTVKLQIGKINKRLDRLTDCYVDEGLEKEIYERRKQAILVELKEAEQSMKELMTDKPKILKKTQQFLELVISLTNSYRIANMDEKRKLLEIVTSNLSLSQKKLTITMKNVFAVIGNRHLFHSGGRLQYRPRTLGNTYTFWDINTSPMIFAPLKRMQLKELLDYLVETIAQVSDEKLSEDLSEIF